MEILVPWRLLKSIDAAGSGGLNHSGITTIRKALKRAFPENNTKDSNELLKKKRRKSLVPSAQTAKHCAYELESCAHENHLSYKLLIHPHEHAKFNNAQLLKFALKHSNLTC